jgi:cell division protein FtsB
MLKKRFINSVALAAFVLSAYVVVGTFNNGNLLGAIHSTQDQILATQSEIQNLQQKIQIQQQEIDAATRLASQAGPAIIAELAGIQLKNGNEALGELLLKHGIKLNPGEEPSGSSKANRNRN